LKNLLSFIEVAIPWHATELSPLVYVFVFLNQGGALSIVSAGSTVTFGPPILRITVIVFHPKTYVDKYGPWAKDVYLTT
jgi:hypothetical protein